MLIYTRYIRPLLPPGAPANAPVYAPPPVKLPAYAPPPIALQTPLKYGARRVGTLALVRHMRRLWI